MLMYKILKNAYLDRLERDVARHMNAGWKLAGGVSVAVVGSDPPSVVLVGSEPPEVNRGGDLLAGDRIFVQAVQRKAPSVRGKK